MKRVIVDHDGGVDDFAALSLLLCRSDIQIPLITICPGDSFKDTALLATKKILDYLKKDNTIIAGSDFAGVHPFLDEWRKHSNLIDKIDLINQGAVKSSNVIIADQASDILVEKLSETIKYTLLCTGPLTNLSDAIDKNPKIVNQIERVFFMGGAVRTGGNVFLEQHDGSAEWNIYNNPPAAKNVFRSGIAITMVALDATNHVPFTEDFVKRIKRQRKYPASELLYQLCDIALKDSEANDPYFFGIP
ncbi:MAG: nucleoside hydrolase [Spirochaetes bacterium]|nr:nucleoside hydrolase [Spirochaetota bacterium]